MCLYKAAPYCSGFQCTMNRKCIHYDMKCDGVDHCFDNSDERLCR